MATTAVADMTPEAKAVELINACKLGRYGMVKALLVTKHASVRARDATGWSPLLWASFNGHHRIVELLLEHGAAEDWREEFGIEDVLEMTQETDDDPSPEQDDPRATFKPVNSPLHWAVYRGHLRTVWALIRAGFSTMDIDESGNTALHLAAMNGNEDIVRSVMMVGFQVRQLNLNGNDPLAVASTPAARTLLHNAAEQRVCPDSKYEFGPRQPQFLCFSTGQFFSDEASNQLDVPAFATLRSVKKPVRVSNKREYEIQDAEAALLAVLNTNGVLDGDNTLQAQDTFAFGTPAPDGVAGIDEDALEQYREEDGDTATASGAGGPQAEAETRPEASPSPSGGGNGAPPGLGLGVAAIVEEGDEEDEEEDEEDDNDGNGGEGNGTDGFGSLRGSHAHDGSGKPDEVAAIAAAADAEPKTLPWPADIDEGLGASDIEALRTAIDAVKTVKGSVWLIARAERAFRRVTAWAEAEKEAETVKRQRPLKRAAETAELRKRIRRAAEAGVGERLHTLRRVVHIAELECGVRDMEAVCETIPLATHDFDADMERLSSSIKELSELDSASSVLSSASTLSARLAVEVEVSDSVQSLEDTLKTAIATFEECREDDPTTLPLPELTEEELEAKRKAEEEAAAAKEAAAKTKGRGKQAQAEPEEEEEPLPPLYPSPQLQATEKVQASAGTVRQALQRAREAGADEALVDKTSGRVDSILAKNKELWDDEIARIRVFEAERIKREKKKKKKGKKKKGK